MLHLDIHMPAKPSKRHVPSSSDFDSSCYSYLAWPFLPAQDVSCNTLRPFSYGQCLPAIDAKT